VVTEKPTFYWDSCIFIAWLQNEKRQAGEMEGIREMVSQLDRNEAKLVTSVITETEVLESTLTQVAQQKFSAVLRRRCVQVVTVDRKISKLAHEIRDFYKKQPNRKRTISSPDSIHLATAIFYKVDPFYTFDENDDNENLGLIPLSGIIAGKYKLIIKKPMGQQLDAFNSIK